MGVKIEHAVLLLGFPSKDSYCSHLTNVCIEIRTMQWWNVNTDKKRNAKILWKNLKKLARVLFNLWIHAIWFKPQGKASASGTMQSCLWAYTFSRGHSYFKHNETNLHFTFMRTIRQHLINRQTFIHATFHSMDFKNPDIWLLVSNIVNY